MIIDKISVLAEKFYPFRRVSFILALVFIAIIFYGVIFLAAEEQNRFTMLSLLGLLWTVFFNVLLNVFHKVPSQPANNNSLFQRIKLTIQRFFYTLLAIFFLLLTAVVIFLTIRMINI